MKGFCFIISIVRLTIEPLTESFDVEQGLNKSFTIPATWSHQYQEGQLREASR